MIVYSFIEELKIIIYLLSFSISFISIYDVLINHIKNKIKYVIQLLYCLGFIYLSYQLAFKMLNGYIPQYCALILISGIIIYYVFIKQKFYIHAHQIEVIIKFFIMIIKTIFKPLSIVKTTFLLFKRKKVKNNNQNTLQK